MKSQRKNNWDHNAKNQSNKAFKIFGFIMQKLFPEIKDGLNL